MKLLLLGAGVIVLVGSGWAFGRYGSDLRPTLNTAILSTTTAIETIEEALGDQRVGTFPREMMTLVLLALLAVTGVLYVRRRRHRLNRQ